VARAALTDPSSARLHPALLGLVAVGGALGAVARCGLGELFPGDTTGFPWTTFSINVVGSGLLAALPALRAVRGSRSLVALLGPGLLGGFTTLSTYSEQARRLAVDGSVGLAAAYVVGTLAACLTVVAAVGRFTTRDERDRFEQADGDR